MIIGIEGTGSQDWDNMNLRRSFVRKVLEQSPERDKAYFIGPNKQGSDGSIIVRAAWHKLHIGGFLDSRIVLVGYSRGAAYCIKLAEMWQKAWGDTKPIDVMVLFDAVARNKYSESKWASAGAYVAGAEEVDIPDQIPACVSICLHAVRNPQAGSRAGFGNTGLSVQDRARTSLTLKQDFMCSHGAMGGTAYDAKNEEGAEFAGTYNIQFDSNTQLNKYFPSDPRYAGAPKYPVTGKIQDDIGMRHVGRWMWDLLKRYQVVSRSGDPLRNAHPFTGLLKPGVPNSVR